MFLQKPVDKKHFVEGSKRPDRLPGRVEESTPQFQIQIAEIMKIRLHVRKEKSLVERQTYPEKIMVAISESQSK